MIRRSQENLNTKEKAKAFNVILCSWEIAQLYLIYARERKKEYCYQKIVIKKWRRGFGGIKIKTPRKKKYRIRNMLIFDNCQDMLNIEVTDAQIE